MNFLNNYRSCLKVSADKAASALLLVLLLLLPEYAVAAEGVDNPLQSEKVRLQSLSRVFRLDGVVEAINQATVSAQTGGTIQDIKVDVDDYVEKGEIIISLKDVSQQAQLKKAQAGEK